MNFNSRRTFLQGTLLGSAVLVMSGTKLFGAVSPMQTLQLLQADLFPHAVLLGINPTPYLALIFNHSRVDEETKAFLRNGVQWLNEEAVSHYKILYVKLSDVQREELLKIISRQQWGENFMDTVLTFTMEAVLGDPIYGGNKNETGWKWLHFEGGRPRPKELYL